MWWKKARARRKRAMAKGGPWRVNKHARTGKFVSNRRIKYRPRTTYRQTVNRR